MIERSWLWAMVAAQLALFAFLVFTVSVSLAAYRAADHARLQDTARVLASAVGAELGILDAGLQALAASPLMDGPATDPAVLEHARLVGESLGGTISFADPGEAAADEAPAGLPRLLPLSPAREIRGIISDLTEEGGAPRLWLSVPVRRAGELRHLLRFSFTPALLRPLLLQLYLRGGAFAAIADGQLRILAHSRDPEGQRIGVPAPAWVRGAVADKQRVLVTGPGWQNKPNVYAVERLSAAQGWTVVVAEPESEIEAAAWAAVSWLLLGGAAVALGLGVAAWFARRASLSAALREAELLREGRAEQGRIMAALPVIITLRDVAADGTSSLLFRNGNIAAVTGWPGEELREQNDIQHLVAPEAEGLQAFLRHTLRDGVHRDEVRMRRPDGSWSWVRREAVRLRPDGRGGGEVLMYTINKDRERQAEARVIASSRRASLGDMSTGLAHELLQPLTAILLSAENAQVALRDSQTGSVDLRLERIIAQALRASAIIEDLRRFARAPEDKPHISSLPLDGPVSGALTLTSGMLRDVDVQVELGIEPPFVLGERGMIEHVLVNLLSNARDALASLSPEVPRRLRIVAQKIGDTVRLSVADNGGGVDPAVLDRLFEPFVTTKGPDRGVGLGLSVAVGLLEQLGGSIELGHEAGGAIFFITLPAGTPPLTVLDMPPSPSPLNSP